MTAISWRILRDNNISGVWLKQQACKELVTATDPDPNYDTVVEVQHISLPDLGNITDAEREWFEDLAEFVSLKTAIREISNKYEGAKFYGDPTWMEIHARKGIEVGNQLRYMLLYWDQSTEEMINSLDYETGSLTPEQIQDINEHLTSDGVPQETQDQASQLSVEANIIADTENSFTYLAEQNHGFDPIFIPSEVILTDQIVTYGWNDVLALRDSSLDLSAPSTTLSLSGIQGNGSWYTSSVDVTLTGIDEAGGSGFHKAEYSFDYGRTWNEYTNVITLNDGIHNILARSIDNDGNIEFPPQEAKIYIDTTPPTTVAYVTGPLESGNRFRGDVALEFESYDDLSGVAQIEYSLDNGQNWTTILSDTVSIEVTETIWHDIKFRATDKAGNVETEQEAGFFEIYKGTVFGHMGEVHINRNVDVQINGHLHSTGDIHVGENNNFYVDGYISLEGAFNTLNNIDETYPNPDFGTGYSMLNYDAQQYRDIADVVYPSDQVWETNGIEVNGTIYVEGSLTVRSISLSGSATIVADGSIVIESNSVDLASNDPDNGIVLFSKNGNIVFSGVDLEAYGHLYAPQGDIRILANCTRINGSIMANSITIEESGIVVINHHGVIDDLRYQLPDLTLAANPDDRAPINSPMHLLTSYEGGVGGWDMWDSAVSVESVDFVGASHGDKGAKFNINSDGSMFLQSPPIDNWTGAEFVHFDVDGSPFEDSQVSMVVTTDQGWYQSPWFDTESLHGSYRISLAEAIWNDGQGNLVEPQGLDNVERYGFKFNANGSTYIYVDNINLISPPLESSFGEVIQSFENGIGGWNTWDSAIAFEHELGLATHGANAAQFIVGEGLAMYMTGAWTTDLSDANGLGVDIFNDSAQDVNISMVLATTGGWHESVTNMLRPGWNSIMLDLEAATWNDGQGNLINLRNPNQIQEQGFRFVANGYTNLYVDNIRMLGTQQESATIVKDFNNGVGGWNQWDNAIAVSPSEQYCSSSSCAEFSFNAGLSMYQQGVSPSDWTGFSHLLIDGYNDTAQAIDFYVVVNTQESGWHLSPKFVFQPGQQLLSFDLTGNNWDDGQGNLVSINGLGNVTSMSVRFNAPTWGSIFLDDVRLSEQYLSLAENTTNISINFQPETAPVPTGYLKDFGESYGARNGTDQGTGLTYGWVYENTGLPYDSVGYARDRNVNSDQRLDTYMSMHDFNPDNREPGSWEIALPTGNYSVTVSVGEPVYHTSINRVELEGIVLIDNVQLAANQFHEATMVVHVSDGKLTLAQNDNGALDTKINYVIVEATTNPVTLPADPTASPILINFQPETAPVPTGYLKDFGESYGIRTDADQGAGLAYGWVYEDTGQPYDSVGYARDRNVNPDQRLDTYMSMHDFNPDNREPGSWEIALPTGNYSVTVSVGEPVYHTSINRVEVEGVVLIDNVQMAANQFHEATMVVHVSDAKLTLAQNDNGALDTKINYVIIEPTLNPVTSPADPHPVSTQVETYEDGTVGWTKHNGVTSIATSNQHATHGSTSLEVQTDGSWGAAQTWSLEVTDWSGGELLIFDVYNASANPIDIRVNMRAGDPWIESITSRMTVNAGAQIIEVSLDPEWVADLSVVTSLGFIMEQNGNPTTLYFDNVRVTASEKILINFQPETSPVPDGYLKDFGESYGARAGADQGAGLTYGWVYEDTGQPYDSVGYARDRNVNSDQRLDTYMSMHDFNPSNREPGAWEVELPTGNYSVTVSVGEPVYHTSINRVEVEGVVLIDNIQLAANQFHEATMVVHVSDGKLTLAQNDNGALDTKINYVIIEATTNPATRSNALEVESFEDGTAGWSAYLSKASISTNNQHATHESTSLEVQTNGEWDVVQTWSPEIVDWSGGEKLLFDVQNASNSPIDVRVNVHAGDPWVESITPRMTVNASSSQTLEIALDPAWIASLTPIVSIGIILEQNGTPTTLYIDNLRVSTPDSSVISTAVTSYEDSDLSNWTWVDGATNAEVANQHATDGNQSLKLSFDGTWGSFFKFSYPHPESADWSSGSGIAVDIYNDTNANHTFSFILAGPGWSVSPQVTVVPGANTLEFDFDDPNWWFANPSDLQPITDLTQVTYYGYKFWNNSGNAGSMYVDNLRLVHNVSDASWSINSSQISPSVYFPFVK